MVFDLRKDSTEVSTHWKVTSVANMRLVTHSPDTIIVTDGRFGSNYFKKIASGTENGGTIFVLNNSDVYELQYEGAVNVKWFGAVGDGVIDDTTAVQKTFDSANKTRLVDMPDIYKISSKVIIANSVIIRGYNTGQIVPNSDNVYLLVNAEVEYFEINGIEVDNSSQTYGNGLTLGVSNDSNGTIFINKPIVEKCIFKNCKIVVSSTYGGLISECILEEGSMDIFEHAGCLTISENTIVNVTQELNGISGLVVGDFPSDSRRGGHKIINNTINTTRMGIELRDRKADNTNFETGTIISGNDITTTGIVYPFGLSFNCNHVKIADNKIAHIGIGTHSIGIELASNLIVTGNQISGFINGITTTTNLITDITDNVLISNNSITQCKTGITTPRYASNITIEGNSVYGVFYDDGTAYGIGNAEDIKVGGFPHSISILNNIVKLEYVNTSSGLPKCISMQGFKDSVCNGNTCNIVSDRSGYAVFLGSSINVQITDNLLTGTQVSNGLGLSKYNTGNASVKDNTFVGFKKGIEEYGGSAEYSVLVSGNNIDSCLDSQTEIKGEYSSTFGKTKIAYRSTIPTAGSWNAKDKIIGVDTLPNYVCTTSGTAHVIRGATTAELTNGSNVFTVDTLEFLEYGSWIKVGTHPYTIQILDIDYLTKEITVFYNLTVTESGAAVTHQPPVFEALGSRDAAGNLPTGGQVQTGQADGTWLWA